MLLTRDDINALIPDKVIARGVASVDYTGQVDAVVVTLHLTPSASPGRRRSSTAPHAAKHGERG